MKRIFLFKIMFIALVAINFQCGQNAPVEEFEGTIISGTVEGAADLKIFLDKYLFNSNYPIVQSSVLDSKGKFELKIPTLEPGMYRIRIGAKRLATVFGGNEKQINLNAKITEFDNYTIDGSKDAQVFSTLIKALQENPAKKSEVVTSFIDTTSSTFAALRAVTLLGVEKSTLDYHAKIQERLTSQYPSSEYTNLWKGVTGQMRVLISQMAVRVGEIPPEIDLPSPSGTNYKLSDLKGQVVLIDFWASWCRPCRFNNPHLVKMYDKYKSKGFTVYSVSLDRQKAAWEKAIEQDKLDWPYHVSDLKYWQCAPAKAYNVRGIPYTVLLDKDGTIAALNLRGPQLEQEIAKLL